MQRYKGLINATGHVFFRRLNALRLGIPAVDHLLVTGCFVPGSLNYHHISHLHISLVKLRRTYVLIYHLVHLDKGLMGRGWEIQLVLWQVAQQLSESGLLFPQSPMCHAVVHIVLQILGRGTLSPFTKEERHCWALKLFVFIIQHG